MPNFNSHAHVERDNDDISDEFEVVISTHTLTWSVTFIFCSSLGKSTISTHTLTWSVTNKILYIYGEYYISTHTLTWSVTTG